MDAETVTCGRCGCPWHAHECAGLRHPQQICPQAVRPEIFANIQLSQICMLLEKQNVMLQFIAQSVDPERSRLHIV